MNEDDGLMLVITQAVEQLGVATVTDTVRVNCWNDV